MINFDSRGLLIPNNNIIISLSDFKHHFVDSIPSETRCGCSDNGIYLVDANGKFDILFKTYQSNSDVEGEEYSSNVVLPLNPEVENITYREYEQSGLYDKNDNPILDKSGNIETEVIKDRKQYFRWDGFKIIEQK